MSKPLRCPNPECTHLFAAESVAGLAALVCPVCGGVFQRHAPPRLQSGGSTTSAAATPSGPGWIRWVTVAALAFGLGCLAIALWVILGRKPATHLPEPFRSPSYNYSFLVPTSPWQQDASLRSPGIVFALSFRRNQPDAWFVVALRDSKAGYPFDSEVGDDTAQLLRSPLGLAHIALEPRDDAVVAGEPAQRHVFQADRGGAAVSGDVHVVRRQGFVYWMIRFALTKDVSEAQPGLDDLRDRFGWLDQRPGWQPSRQRFAGPASGVAVTAEGGRWAEAPFPAKQYDPLADLALEARLMGSTSRDLLNVATIKLLVLPAGDGKPLERARKHLLVRQRDEFPESKIVDLAPLENAPDPAGAAVAALKVDRGANREWFVWLAAAPFSGGVAVIQGECVPDRRAIWEPEFRRLTATLELSK